MCAFFFFYRALFCSFEYASNTCVFSTHLAVFGSGFPLYVLAFICSQNELKHPTKVYTIKLVMFYVATCHKSIIFFHKGLKPVRLDLHAGNRQINTLE
jgi:hypothetical protein